MRIAMNHIPKAWWFLILATLLCLAGCADETTAPPAQEGEPAVGLPDGYTLGLVLAQEEGEQLAVDLYYQRPEDNPGPRMMELFVRPSPGLKYLSSEPLAVVTSAGKQLVTQEQEDGTIRLVVFATSNLNRLESGPVARLVLARQGQGSQSLELVDQRPVFAPTEAEQGTTLAEPLIVGGP